MRHPRPFVEWIAVEEQAEGGDALYHQGEARSRGSSRDTRVAEGGGVALISNDAPIAPSSRLRAPTCQKRNPKVKFVVQPPRSSLSPRKPASSSPLRLGLLPADLAADDEVAGQAADAAENRRAGGRAVGDVARREDRAVDVDELADFAVAPADRHQPGADVRLDAAAAERQEARGERHGIVRSFRSCAISLPSACVTFAIDARHGALVVAHADARFEVRATPNRYSPPNVTLLKSLTSNSSGSAFCRSFSSTSSSTRESSPFSAKYPRLKLTVCLASDGPE